VHQLQAFRHHLQVQHAGAGEIAARPVEAAHQAKVDRVESGCEHDRNSRGGRLGREGGRAIGGDDVDLAAHQLRRQRRQPIVVVLGPTVFDRDITTLDIADFA
jgi:hypothetical protein